MLYPFTVAITFGSTYLHEGEFALRIILLFGSMQYRTCHEETSLREVCGGSFVIVNDDLEAQFQDFKRLY